MRRLRVSFVIGVALSLLSIGTAYAYNITNATYTGTVRITNNGSAAAYNQTANFTLNTTALINAGFLNASVNNSAMVYAGQDVPYMPGASGNQSWFVWVGNISALTNLDYTLYMGGNQTMNSTQVYFPGTTGMAVTDNASMELLTSSTNYTITIIGSFNFTSGAGKELLVKGTTDYEIRLGQNEQGLVDGGISVFNAGNIQVGASLVANGYHNITINATGVATSIVVDGVTLNTSAVRAPVANTVNNWAICTSNTTDYMVSFSLSTNQTTRASYTWQYKATWPVLFSDLSLNGNTATPSFPTGGSSANVTANMTGFAPITQTTSDLTNPTVTASNITQAFVQPPGLYTELNISAPGANLTNSLLDGSNIPRAIFWFPFLFGIIGLLGFATAWLTRSMLIQGLVMAFTMILFSLMGGFGYWVCIEFIIMASAIIVGGKQYGF